MSSSQDVTLGYVDWIVIGCILVVPMVIGVVFAVRDSSRLTIDEYLVGGRNMAMLPVALSIFVTFQSAVSLMGIPTEIYTFGAMMFANYIGIGLAYVAGIFLMVPLMYPLRMTSVYEYMERRFRSKLVRRLSTATGMMQTLFYMAIVLLAPALALQAAAGVGLWLSIAIVGGVGTVYSAIGGLKSIVWTDAFQCVVIFAGIIIIIIKGSLAVGDFSTVWAIAEEGGRTKLDKVSFDLRSRHTWWSMILGGFFMWMVNIYNQSTIQRVASVRSKTDARLMFGLNVPFGFLYAILLTLMGLVMYAYFTVTRCDPFQSGAISNRNQVGPYFVVQALRDTPGIAGLFIATLFSAGLSTVSSGICALAANTVEDFLKPCLRKFSEKSATIITKILVATYGLVTMALAFAATSLDGPVTQLAASVFGSMGSPILGVFLTGTCVPWVNSIGAISGGVISLAFNLWIAIGSRMYGTRSAPLPAPPTDRCFNGNFTDLTVVNSSSSSFHNYYYSYTTTESSLRSSSNSTAGGEVSHESVLYLYDISYEWYAVLGTVISVVVCLLVSFVTRSKLSTKVPLNLIMPGLRKFWIRFDDRYLNVDLNVDDAEEMRSLKDKKTDKGKTGPKRKNGHSEKAWEDQSHRPLV